MLRIDFEIEGYRVFDCESAPRALDLLNDEKIDVVITDFRMPGMTGYELLVAIRSEISKKHPEVIIISGFADCTDEKAQAAGAAALLPKPIEFEKLLALTRTLAFG